MASVKKPNRQLGYWGFDLNYHTGESWLLSTGFNGKGLALSPLTEDAIFKKPRVGMEDNLKPFHKLPPLREFTEGELEALPIIKDFLPIPWNLVKTKGVPMDVVVGLTPQLFDALSFNVSLQWTVMPHWGLDESKWPYSGNIPPMCIWMGDMKTNLFEILKLNRERKMLFGITADFMEHTLIPAGVNLRSLDPTQVEDALKHWTESSSLLFLRRLALRCYERVTYEDMSLDFNYLSLLFEEPWRLK